jgi:hypothetical protein
MMPCVVVLAGLLLGVGPPDVRESSPGDEQVVDLMTMARRVALADLIRPGMSHDQWWPLVEDSPPDHQFVYGHGCLSVSNCYVWVASGLTVREEDGKVSEVAFAFPRVPAGNQFQR